jgi:hypothetical protein
MMEKMMEKLMENKKEAADARQFQDSFKTVSRQCQGSAKWFADSILR